MSYLTHKDLKVGDHIYRFQFDLTCNEPLVEKHTLEVVDIRLKNSEPVSWPRQDQFKFKCVEYPKRKYKDGSFVELDEEREFSRVRASGNHMYVLLREDDFETAHRLVVEYLINKVEEITQNLNRMTHTLEVFSSYAG